MYHRPAPPCLSLTPCWTVCSTTGDEAEQLTQAAAGAQHASAAEAAMGAALQYVGPDVVLSVLPLNLKEGLDGSGEARTWLLPMIKRHVKGARLDFWHRALMPVAKAMGSRAAVATRAGQRSLAATCHALELQIWAMLPAFCTWPADGAAAYRGLAKDLGAAFTAREDLRVPICMALQRLCLQQRRVLVDGGEKEMVGYAEPAGAGGWRQGWRGGGSDVGCRVKLVVYCAMDAGQVMCVG
jgi:ribosomal RNA-processing protein 12